MAALFTSPVALLGEQRSARSSPAAFEPKLEVGATAQMPYQQGLIATGQLAPERWGGQRLRSLMACCLGVGGAGKA